MRGGMTVAKDITVFSIGDWKRITVDGLRAFEPQTVLMVHASAARILADALEIADESAIALIECETLTLGDHFDLATAHDPDLSDEVNASIRESLEQAVRYLKARGLLERDAERPTWVRFTDNA